MNDTQDKSELVTVYVIWRGDEDDFFITRLDLEPLMLAPGNNRLNNQQIVQMAWDVEYHDIDEYGMNPFVGENAASYELIEVFSGNNINFHMQ